MDPEDEKNGVRREKMEKMDSKVKKMESEEKKNGVRRSQWSLLAF
jgi:hypothetical protein